MPPKAFPTCIVTGDILVEGDGLRLVLSPDGAWLPDVKGTLPAKKALWITGRRSVIEKAAESGLLEGADAHILCTAAEKQLKAAVLGLLGMARRSGQLVTGFTKVSQAAKADQIAVLLLSGSDKTDSPFGTLPGVLIVKRFTGEELEATLKTGKDVHALLDTEGIAGAFKQAYQRLTQFDS